jgi:hypothetical protein
MTQFVSPGCAPSQRWSASPRLCAARFNARKQDFNDVLDPFEVEDGWFQVELVGFQILPAANLSPATRRQVEQTISRLQLNHYDLRRSRE